MFLDDIDNLSEDINITGDTITSFNDNFRAIAGNRLHNCKDFKGLLKKYGIQVDGDDEYLSRVIYLNCIVLLSFDNDEEIALSEDRAILLARKDGKSCKKFSPEEVLDWFIKSMNLLEDDNEEQVEDSKSANNEDDSFKESKDKIKSYYQQFYKGVVSELTKRYTSLFESGYEVITPAGILAKDGMLGLSGNKLVLKNLIYQL